MIATKKTPNCTQNAEKKPVYEPSSWEFDLLTYISKKQLYKLEQEFGTNYIYIHRHPRNEIIDAIGAEAASMLSKHYGASWIYVPQYLYRHIRNGKIYEQFKKGTDIAILANQFGIKTPAIKEILRKKFGYKKSKI